MSNNSSPEAAPTAANASAAERLTGHTFAPDIGFRYLLGEEEEYALRDLSIALSEIATQYDRPDIGEVTGGGMAAILRTFARATGRIAIATSPPPKGFRAR
jgi:hypothetical protein